MIDKPDIGYIGFCNNQAFIVYSTHTCIEAVDDKVIESNLSKYANNPLVCFKRPKDYNQTLGAMIATAAYFEIGVISKSFPVSSMKLAGMEIGETDAEGLEQADLWE